MHSSSASSLFSHLEFGHYVMSPSYLAVLVRCLGVLSSCAILGENIVTSWVSFTWRLALSVLRVSVRGLSC